MQKRTILGIVIALLVSYVMNLFIKIKEKSFFILELPVYRQPRWKNILYTMVEKAKVFVFDAGKVIMIISLVPCLELKSFQMLPPFYQANILILLI